MLRVNDDEETAAASIAATTAAGADASSMHSAAEGSSSSEAVAPELKKRKRSVTTDLDETIEVDRRAPAQVSLLTRSVSESRIPFSLSNTNIVPTHIPLPTKLSIRAASGDAASTAAAPSATTYSSPSSTHQAATTYVQHPPAGASATPLSTTPQVKSSRLSLLKPSGVSVSAVVSNSILEQTMRRMSGGDVSSTTNQKPTTQSFGFTPKPQNSTTNNNSNTPYTPSNTLSSLLQLPQRDVSENHHHRYQLHQEAIAGLKKQLDDAERARESDRQHANALQGELEQARDTILRLTAANEVQEDNIEELLAQVEELKGDNYDAAVIGRLREDLECVVKESAVKLEELQSLLSAEKKNSIAQSATSAEHIQSFKTQLEQSKSDQLALQRQLEASKGDLAAALSAKDGISRTAKDQLMQAEKYVKDQGDKIAGLEAKVAKKDDLIEEAGVRERKLIDSAMKAAQEFSAAESELAKLRNEMYTVKNAAREFAESKKILEQTIHDLTNTNQTLQQANTSLKLSEETLNQAITDMQQENMKLKNSNEILAAEISEKNAALEQPPFVPAAVSALHFANTNALSNLPVSVQTQHNLRELSNKCYELELKSERLSFAVEEARLESMTKPIQVTISTVNAEVQTLPDESVQKHINSLQAANDSLQALLSATEVNLAVSEDTCQELGSEVEKLQGELVAIQASHVPSVELDAAIEARDTLTMRIAELEKSASIFAEQQRAGDDTSKAYKLLEEQLAQSETQRVILEESTQYARTQSDQLSLTVASLTSDIKAKQEQIECTEARCIELSSAVTRLEEEVLSMSASLTESQAVIERNAEAFDELSLTKEAELQQLGDKYSALIEVSNQAKEERNGIAAELATVRVEYERELHDLQIQTSQLEAAAETASHMLSAMASDNDAASTASAEQRDASVSVIINCLSRMSARTTRLTGQVEWFKQCTEEAERRKVAFSDAIEHILADASIVEVSGIDTLPALERLKATLDSIKLLLAEKDESLVAYARKNEEVEETLANKLAQCDSLNSELDAAKNSLADSVNALVEYKRRYEADLVESVDNVSRVKDLQTTMMTQKEEEISALTAQLTSAEERFTLFEKESSVTSKALSTEVARLTEEVAAAVSTAERLQSDWNLDIKQREEANENLRKSVESTLSVKISEAEQKILSLENSLAESQASCAELQSKIQLPETSLSASSLTLDTLQNFIIAELFGIIQACSDINIDLSEDECVDESLLPELSQRSIVLKLVNQCRRIMVGLKSIYTEQLATSASLRAELVSCKVQITIMTDDNAKSIEALRVRCSELLAAKESVEEEQDSIRRQKGDLERELTDARSVSEYSSLKLSESELQIERLTEQIESLKEREVELSSELVIVREAESTAVAQFQSCNHEVQELKGRISELQSVLQEKDAAFAAMQSANVESSGNLKSLQAELERLEDEKLSLLEDLDLKTTEIGSMSGRVVDLAANLEESMSNKAVLEKDLNEVKVALADRDTTISQFEKALLIAQAEIERVSQESDNLRATAQKSHEFEALLANQVALYDELQDRLKTAEMMRPTVCEISIQTEYDIDVKLAEVKREAEMIVSKMEAHTIDLEKSAQDMALAQQGYLASVDAITAERDELMRELSEVRADLNKNKVAFIVADEQVAKLQLDMAAKDLSISDLQDQVKSLAASHNDTQLNLSAKDIELEEMTTRYKQRSAELEAQILDLKENMNKLISSHTIELQNFAKDAENQRASEQELSSLRNRCKSAEETAKSAMEHVKAVKAKLDQVAQSLEVQLEQNKTLRTELEESKRILELTILEKEDAMSKHMSMSTQQSDLNERLASSEITIKSLQQQILTQQNKLTLVRNETDCLRSELEETKQLSVELEQRAKENLEQNEVLLTKTLNLTKDNKRLTAAKLKLEKSIESMKKENQLQMGSLNSGSSAKRPSSLLKPDAENFSKHQKIDNVSTSSVKRDSPHRLATRPEVYQPIAVAAEEPSSTVSATTGARRRPTLATAALRTPGQSTSSPNRRSECLQQ